MERFSTLEDAVQAVDYEIDRSADAPPEASARDDAAVALAATAARAGRARLRAKERATTHAEALRLAVWEAVTRR